MTNIIVATLLFLFTINTLADVKNREKAKFDLINSIETLVNIDECRKSLHTDKPSILPKACNRLAYLSKYFFDPKKDRRAIEQYLNNEEAAITENAFKLSTNYNITKLGKITLSTKCVKNRDPVDLDIYLNRIKGIPYTPDESREAGVTAIQLETRNPAHELYKQAK